MKQITFNKDQVIFRENEFATVMYDIVSGKVGIFTGYQTDQEKKIAELEAGTIFGEMGMIEFYPRSATAVALTDDTLLQELAEADLSEYLKDKPEKLLPLMRQLSARIRETTQKYVEACSAMNENKRAEEEKDQEAGIRSEEEMEQYASLYTRFWM